MTYALMRHWRLPDTEMIVIPSVVIPGHELAGWEVVTTGPESDALWPVDETNNAPAEPDEPADPSAP